MNIVRENGFAEPNTGADPKSRAAQFLVSFAKNESIMNKHKALILFLPLLFFCTPVAHSDETSLAHYWINKKIDWQHPNTGDPEIDQLTEAATVVSIIFADNGQFRMISTNGSLGEDGTIYQHVEIFNIYVGKWNLIENNKIEIEYFHASRLIKIVGEELDFVSKKEILEITNVGENKQFHFLYWDFVVANHLSQRDKERLSKLSNIDSDKLKEKS